MVNVVWKANDTKGSDASQKYLDKVFGYFVHKLEK